MFFSPPLFFLPLDTRRLERRGKNTILHFTFQGGHEFNGVYLGLNLVPSIVEKFFLMGGMCG